MNANEQIKMLRRACEMARDWIGDNFNATRFREKFGDIPTGGVCSFVKGSLDESLSATATPPDDDAKAIAESWQDYYEKAAKERDDALACDLIAEQKKQIDELSAERCRLRMAVMLEVDADDFRYRNELAQALRELADAENRAANEKIDHGYTADICIAMQKQIKALRAACEMVMDWYGAKLSAGAFHDKWNPPNMPGAAYADATYETVMAATATPPDDAKPISADDFAAVLMKVRSERDECCADYQKEAARAVAAEKERDDALAKLAEKEKELADIAITAYDAAKVSQHSDYAAKPEPEFRADENRIQQRRLSWCHFATIAPQDGANSDGKAEAIAKRIADALNGVKP